MNTCKIRRVGLIGLSVVGLIVAGCASASGTWKLRDIAPPAAEKTFDWKTIRLMDNGNFEADALRDGKSVAIKGTWTYDKSKKALDLRDTTGASHAFNAEIIDGGKALLLWNVGATKEWTARFDRG